MLRIQKPVFCRSLEGSKLFAFKAQSPVPRRAFFASAFCLLWGCSHFQTFELPRDPAHTWVNSQEKNGLRVGAELIIDPLSIEHHFGPELKETEYYPVFVYLENRGASSFEIRRSKFNLLLEDGEKLEAAPPEAVLSRMRRSSAPAFFLAPLVVPAIIALRNIHEYNFEMARTLYQKAFPSSLRLEERDPPLSRAIFFRDPNGKVHKREDFESSVLQTVVEVEGSRPIQDGTGTEAPKEGQKAVVGKLVLFTVSLSGENAR